MYENGKVYHRRGLVWLPYFENELMSFPRGKKDDFSDSFSFAKELLTPPRRPMQNRYHQTYAYVT
jgi:phage terminase large subunit-like protein